MAAVTYIKENWKAEADIQRLPNGKFQGVVLITRVGSIADGESPRAVNTVSDTPEEALEEAKALAHRILADL
jgi:ClpP class serine protease